MTVATQMEAGPLAVKVTATKEKVGSGLTVLRALPKPELQAVGPFVFLDHFGPATPPKGGVPAHPHAGIDVVSYLLDGENDHRDSFGNATTVAAGGAQWIGSGRGMLHAEVLRGSANGEMESVQLWARQAESRDDAPPTYGAAAARDIPLAVLPEKANMRLLAGALPQIFGEREGPVGLTRPALLVHARIAPGATISAPLPEAFDMAVYVLSGVAGVGGSRLARGDLAALRRAAEVELANLDKAQPLAVLLLGGAPLPQPPLFRGPYVFDSAEALERAFADYSAGRMGRLDGVPS